MGEFDEGVQANMDVVFEEAGAALPNGGAHETRRSSRNNSIGVQEAGNDVR
jgi:hypothetical protein